MVGGTVERRHNIRRVVALLGLILLPLTAQAQDPAAPQPMSDEARKQEAMAAWGAALGAATKGPSDVALLNEAHLRLPADMVFIPSAPAGRLLRAWGNKVNTDPIGLIEGTRNQDNWAIIIRFVKEGFIKEDDAKEWNAEELLNGIRESNDLANEDRRARGFPEIEVIGWIAPPAYDTTTHRLVSSIAQRRKGAPESDVQGVNYITYALGRYGYFASDMLTNRKDVDHDRAAATAVLAGLDYDAGHRYADFDASNDHVAAYGLAALVGVVAVKKLGLLALAGVFVLKFAKIGAIAVAVVVGLASRLFKRRPKTGGGAV
jgi:uncharacterized membrane-anchored protein